MSTRREMALAMAGLPLMAGTVKAAQMNPYSEAAARVISYTLYGEARGEPFKGKMAVASVIQTRARLAQISLAETCIQEKQFTCWNEIDDVPAAYITGAGLKPADIKARSDCYGIAWVLMSSSRKWQHLTHFYNPDKARPEWARSLRGRKKIGSHVFGYMDL